MEARKICSRWQLTAIKLAHQMNNSLMEEPHQARLTRPLPMNDWLLLSVIFLCATIIPPLNCHGYFPHCPCDYLINIFHLLSTHISVDGQGDDFFLSCIILINRKYIRKLFKTRSRTIRHLSHFYITNSDWQLENSNFFSVLWHATYNYLILGLRADSN